MPEHETTSTRPRPEDAAIDDAPRHETAVGAAAAPAADPETLVAYDDRSRRGPEGGRSRSRRCPAARDGACSGRAEIQSALSLLGVLLLACGFIGGVLVEKGQSSSSSSAAGGASGLASRFAALRGAARTGAGASTGGASTGGAAAGGGAFGSSAGAGAGFTRPTAGTVAYLAGSTLYVTNSEGNTVKVKTSAGTTVNKTVKSTVKDIHPGETVTVTGATGSNGAVTAESISAGRAAAASRRCSAAPASSGGARSGGCRWQQRHAGPVRQRRVASARSAPIKAAVRPAG